MLAAIMGVAIEPIPCLADNYAYVVWADADAAGGGCLVVDPSEAAPVAAVIAARGLVLEGIVATHHHLDHVGGIADLLAGAAGKRDVWVAGHALDRGRIPRQTMFADAPAGRFVPTGLTLGDRALVAMHIPGHTRAAIAWGLVSSSAGAPTDVFTGDTLFGAGCGRLFEGTPAEMFGSLQALVALPPETRLWFGHEYTAANLRFAAVAEPDNAAVRERQARAGAAGGVTTPTTVALERDTNPFVRAGTIEELGRRRAAKDTFR